MLGFSLLVYKKLVIRHVETLLPAYAQFVAIDDQPIIAKMLLTHVKIYALIDSLKDASMESLHELGVLADHVREEEGIIFFP